MVYPVYLIEIAPETHKSVFGMCFGMFVNFGIAVSMVAGLESVFGNVDKWQYMLISPLPIYFIQLVFSIFSVESPSWERNCGRVDQAKVSEKKLYGFEVFQSDVEVVQVEKDFWKNYWATVKECYGGGARE